MTNPPATKPHAALMAEAARCAKCGKCRSVCPIFIETGDESAVARGRITLAEAVMSGQLEATGKVKDYMWMCLKCLRCTSICPSGVEYEKILQGMRDEIARRRGVPILARLVFRHILPNRWLFDRFIRMAQWSQRVLPAHREGTLRHLPLAFMGHQSVPALAPQSALELLAHHKPKGGRPQVAFFLGCAINYVYPQIAQAVIEVYDRAGYDVVVPPGQVCCGTPVMCFGARASAQRLARMNVAAFADCDVIVNACASGGRTLKHDYEDLLGPDGKAFGARVFDAAEFLAKEGKLDALGRGDDSLAVTYHDPCHLNWGQGITDAPRQLIRTAAKLVEMNEPERCCGGAGTFSILHYDYACKIGAHKVADIKGTGADVVATGCPGCMIQIADRLDAEGVSTRVKHTFEIAAAAKRDA